MRHRLPSPPATRALLAAALAIAGAHAALAAAPAASPARAPAADTAAGRASKYYEDALERYERNDFAGAAIQLRNAIKNDRRNIAAHLLLGRVLLAVGELKAAEAALEEALKAGVNLSEVAPVLGTVYLQLGDTRKLLDTITTNGMPAAVLPQILTLRGTAYAMSGNLGTAAATFAQARQLDPRAAGPYIAEAPLLLRAGEGDRARSTALKATELAPDSAQAWSQLGTIQLTLGDRKSALASLDKALAIQPKLVDALVARASVLLSEKRLDDAQQLLARLKQDKVLEPRASFMRAVIAESRGDAAVAKAEYTQAANLVDTMPAGLRGSSEPMLMAGALAHKALGNAQRTREYAENVLARNGRHFAAQLLLAQVLVDAGEIPRAQTMLENLLRAAPQEPQVLYLLGSVYLSRKQYAQAGEMFDRAAKHSTSLDVTRELAFSQFGLRQEKVALANLEKVVASNPRDLRAGIELAIYYARKGQAAKASALAESMTKREPGNLMLLNFLGNIKGRVNDNAGMRAAYEQVLAKDPKYRQTIINLSMLDADESQFDAARRRLTAWLKDNPSDAEALMQLGVVEQRAGRPAAATAAWTKADSAQTKDPRPGLALTDQLLSQRQVPQALAAARSLAGKFPEAPVVLMTLARAQMANNDPTAARQSLGEAGKFAGADVGAQLAIARLQLAIGHLDGATYSGAKALQAAPDSIDALAFQVELAAKRGDAAGVDAAMKPLQAKHAGKLPTLLTAGHVALSRKQYAQAVGHYQAAFKLEPAPQVAALVAQAHLASGQTDKALAVLADSARRWPTDANALRALAQVQAAAGKPVDAKDTLAKLVALLPADADALSAYAQLLHRQGDAQGLVLAEKAMKMQPDSAALAGIYGAMLTDKGETESGLRILRDARLREPTDGMIRWNLARALAKAGRKAEARDELRAALSSARPPSQGPELAALKSELGL